MDDLVILSRMCNHYATQDSLGGNARTLLIANINPSGTCMNETNMTLGFAVRARKVRNLAVVNVDHVGDAMTLQMENERLRKELAMYRSMHEVSAAAVAGTWCWRWGGGWGGLWGWQSSLCFCGL